MRLLAGLMGLGALIALSTAPALAECSWMKSADTKMTPLTTAEAPLSTAVATNDLDSAVIREEDAKLRPAEDTDVATQ